MVNEDNEAVYCKFHYKTDQGIKCFDRSVTNVGASNDDDGDGFYSNLVVDTRRTKWPSKIPIMRSGVTPSPSSQQQGDMINTFQRSV